MRRDPLSKEVMSLQCYKATEGRLEGVCGPVDVATNDLTEKRTRITDAYRVMTGQDSNNIDELEE